MDTQDEKVTKQDRHC